MRSFGEKIRDYRIDKDLSQKQMSELIPMNQSNYSKIERGLQEPNLYQLKKIAEILDISVDKLLGITRPNVTREKLENLEKDLNKIYKKYFSD